jgi:uncharacterized membrane protein
MEDTVRTTQRQIIICEDLWREYEHKLKPVETDKIETDKDELTSLECLVSFLVLPFLVAFLITFVIIPLVIAGVLSLIYFVVRDFISGWYKSGMDKLRHKDTNH